VKSKTLLTAVLIVFVLASVVVLAKKEMTKPASGDATPARTAAASAPAGEAKAASASQTKVIAYYFHGKVRCPTCNSIESSAKEAVETGFAEQLKDGRLEWQVVNYEEAGNEHFAKDFDLAAPCVVLVTIRNGKQIDWKSLPEVWEHVGDKPAFIQFVQKNVKEFLDNVAKGVVKT
jgi:hypothetical protein